MKKNEVGEGQRETCCNNLKAEGWGSLQPFIFEALQISSLKKHLKAQSLMRATVATARSAGARNICTKTASLWLFMLIKLVLDQSGD